MKPGEIALVTAIAVIVVVIAVWFRSPAGGSMRSCCRAGRETSEKPGYRNLSRVA
jgi:hypothetical protein